MRVHVTGAAGFIGRHLVAELRSRGHGVSAPGLDCDRVDLTDSEAVDDWFAADPPEAIVHAAWYGGDDRRTSPVNLDWVDITRDLLERFVRHGGRRAVTLGSCFEYELAAEPLIEGKTAVRPHTVYGEAKAAVGDLVIGLDRDGVFSGAHARIGYVYGPGEEPPRLFPALLEAIDAGERFPTTAGRQRRDYLFVTDVVAALAVIVESDVRGPINVGSGNAVPVADLILAIAEAAGGVDLVDIGSLPMRGGDPGTIELSVAPLSELGWQPRVSLVDGARRTVEAARSRRSIDNEANHE